jgi:hypothetical protein
MPPSLADVATPSQETPSKILIPRIFGPPSLEILAAMKFFALLHGNRKPTCPMMATTSKASRHFIMKQHN